MNGVDPTDELMANVCKWAVKECNLPAVANFMHDALPNESYDPHFLGQYLETTYFDTAKYHLRKARAKGDTYITIRLRCYSPPYQPGSPRQDNEEAYALQAKTESEKWTTEITSQQAHAIFADPTRIPEMLPANLQAKLLQITADPLQAVVTVCSHRYAIEDDQDRFTLDTAVATDTGRQLPFNVLEYKSKGEPQPWPALGTINLRPAKVSKFLWATEV